MLNEVNTYTKNLDKNNYFNKNSEWYRVDPTKNKIDPVMFLFILMYALFVVVRLL